MVLQAKTAPVLQLYYRGSLVLTVDEAGKATVRDQAKLDQAVKEVLGHHPQLKFILGMLTGR